MGWHNKGWLMAFGLSLLLLGSGPPARSAPKLPAPAGTLCPWVLVPSPHPSSSTSFYAGVAFAPHDLWAVGHYGAAPASALIAHWDGTAWTTVPAPQRAVDTLQGLAAVSPTELWAVGSSDDPNPGRDTFILHWDGTQWSIVPSPNAGVGTNVLFAASAVSTTDVWAVGGVSGMNGPDNLALHWDGSQWSVVPTPRLGGGINTLYAVTALAAADVWAVGYYDASPRQPLVLHWIGNAWQVVPSPFLPVGGYFRSISATSPQDIWAVGMNDDGTTLIEHWNGVTWSVVPSPSPNPEMNLLQAVLALAPDDAWAVGYQCCAGGINSTLFLHWDGSAWSLVPAPSPSVQGNYPWALAASHAGDIWALGSYIDDQQGDYRTLALHYNAPCATPTPTPVPSATATLSPTSITTPPPTGTLPPPAPSPTPTPCVLTFSDVAPLHPFYPFIRCLACRQVVAGYADGTFRPGLSVTRGQLAKILANAAGLTYAISSTQQAFADVPPAAPFWLFVERLADGGAISGYACGGPGEPCDGQQRPYFRWGAEATRGQISKITARAADLQDPVPSTRQTFADVPTANPFWRWIEQLAGRGVISGYTCGGPGEPCDGQQRPYFRWGTATTRGQMTKIAAQTFFPGCAPPADL